MTAGRHGNIARPARLSDPVGASEHVGLNLWTAWVRVAVEIILLVAWPLVLKTTASALGQRVQDWSSLGWLNAVPEWAWLTTGVVTAALIGLLRLAVKRGSFAPLP